MSWSAGFIAALEAGGPQTWRVRAIQVGTEATFASAYVATSGVPVGDEDPVLCGPPSVQGSTLSIENWSSTIGGMTFDLSGDLTELRAHLTRGTYVEVLLEMGGYVERVTIGRVTQIAYARGRVTLSISDALALLDSRAERDGEKMGLFYELYETPFNSAITSDYTAGDGTLSVASTSGYLHETGGTGVVRVGEFFLTYDSTATTGTTLDVSTSGKFWTDEADTASGALVYDAALIQGHPLDIAVKVLLSTGTGSSSYDTLPESWGYGLSPGLLDIEDIEAERDQVMTVSSGSYSISVVVTEMQDSPRTWLLGILSAFGAFPAMRQGSLTLRAFATLVGKARPTVMTITDADIDQTVGISSEWFCSQQPVEYGKVEVYAQDAGIAGSAEDLATLPGAPLKTYDLQAVLYTNTGEVRTDVYDRLVRVAKRVGELLTLPIAGLGGWQLTVGDRLMVRTELTALRFDYSAGREVWVLQVGPDPRVGRATVRAVSFPPEEPF